MEDASAKRSSGGRPAGPGRTAALGAVAAAWLLAVGGVLLAWSLVFSYGGACPEWESEGTMAAPDSPYSQVLCSETASTIPPALGLGPCLAVVLAVWAGRRSARAGWRRLGLRLAVVLLVPGLTVGALHFLLPEDCLSGRTPSGDCGRDRELS